MARISVLRRGTTRKTRLDHRLISQSDTFELDRYFGSKPTFVFDKPIPVKKGNWIALTVPDLGAAPVDDPGANELVALVARRRATCDPPKSLSQFAMEDLREVSDVRLHLPRRPPALLGHLRPEQPRLEPVQLKPQRGLQPAATSR